MRSGLKLKAKKERIITVYEDLEIYKPNDLLDVDEIVHNYSRPLNKSDRARVLMRHLLPYGVVIHEGKEYLVNRNHVVMQSRKAISEKTGYFFDDGCPPWRYLGQSTDSRLRCEAVLLAWVLEKPLDSYLYTITSLRERDSA